MQVEISIEGQTLVAKISGEVDLNAAPELRKKLDAGLDEAPVLNILFDMSGVEFVDSSGLGVLLGRYNRISRAGGKVYIAGLKPRVRTVFELSGLLRIMEEYASPEEALAKIV